MASIWRRPAWISSIRVWQVSAEGGKIVHSVFAHEAPVIRLAYTADGKTLFSLGEDRTVKAWDTRAWSNARSTIEQPETALSLGRPARSASSGAGPIRWRSRLARYGDGQAAGGAAAAQTETARQRNRAERFAATPDRASSCRRRVAGSLGRAGDVDYYRFEAKAGQEIGVQVQPSTRGAKLEAILQLIDAERTYAHGKREWPARLHLPESRAFTLWASATGSIAAMPA